MFGKPKGAWPQWPPLLEATLATYEYIFYIVYLNL